ncbi:hypothetical protein niasHS_014864 [Heterodera schachtii]|uniref:Uncharacterized protein n=1 Tax=Heterodera schachtii TaxID=97005 RepID=A0ABD2ILZ3_HETSC
MSESNSTIANENEPMQKIRDVPENERYELAIRKLDFCRRWPRNLHNEFAAQSAASKNSRKINKFLPICVDFLGEIVEYFGMAKESICEQIYPSLFEIVSNKIYDDFHPPLDDEEKQWPAEKGETLAKEGQGEQRHGDATETLAKEGEGGHVNALSAEEWHSVEWRHSKLVYELFLLVLRSDKFRVTRAKDFVDQQFVRRLITNVAICPHSEERRCLAQILRSIYLKFVRFRPHIRKHLFYSLGEAVFDERCQLATTKTFHGVAETLDILENVIGGFKVPLKSEEKQMFSKVLLPLHKSDSLESFYKMCIFLDELEVILSKVEDQSILRPMVGRLFGQIAKCISSQNFQHSICGRMNEFFN